MDSENVNLFGDDEPALNETKEDYAVEASGSKLAQSHSANPVRDIEIWFLESLKSVIPEEMHSIYINEGNVLFSCGSLEAEQFDLKRQTECVYEMTNRGKRSVLSSFDTFTFYTNLTYRNEAQRRRVSLDHMTDPAFLRVIEPRTGKLILSNLIKCASQQQKGLRNYLEFVKKNIFSFPLLEELNRFALSQKLAYRAARQKLWFIMSLAEELKLVELGKAYKKYTEKDSVEINRSVLDKRVTLRYFRKTQKQDSVLNQLTKGDSSNSQLLLENEILSSASKISGEALAESALSYSQTDQATGVSISQLAANAGYLQDQNQSFTADMSSINSIPDSNVSATSESSKPIGFSSLHIGEAATPQRKPNNFESKEQVDSFDRNFMKLIDDESTPLFEFDNLMEGSKTQSNVGESSQTGWKGLRMIKKTKIKVEEPRMGHFVQKGLDRFVKKKQSFAFKNALTTVSVLEAACKLYGKGPKWSNPNRKEFDLSNKTKKLVYVKPSRSVKEADLTYQYMLQYASVHQKLNGGVRQEHAVQYGLIEVSRPSQNEPRTYTVNPEPWRLEKFERKWAKLATEVGFSPWLIPKYGEQPAPSADSAIQAIKEVVDSGVQGGSTAVGTVVDANGKAADAVETGGVQGAGTAGDATFNNTVADTSMAEDAGVGEVSQQSKPVSPLSSPIEQQAGHQDVADHQVPPQVADHQVPHDTQLTMSPVDVLKQPELDQTQLYADTQIVTGSYEDTQTIKIKTELTEGALESARTSSTAVDVNDEASVQTEVGECKDGETHLETGEVTEITQVQGAGSEQQGVVNEAQNREQQHGGISLVGPDAKQMKLTELFKYVYTKINKAKNLPEFPELKLINRFNPVIKEELENFSHIDKQVQINARRRKVLDDEYAEPMPADYVKIGETRSRSKVSETLTDSEDEEYGGVEEVASKPLGSVPKDDIASNDTGLAGNETGLTDNQIEVEAEVTGKQVESENGNKSNKQTKKQKLSKKERIMRMREIMKSMIEFEAIESEDENLSDPEEIKRSLELLKNKLMNPSETESEIESETEIAKEMKDFIGDVEINEEDEEIARLRFNEDQMLADDAELKKVMAFKEKGELELTRREERLRMLEELKRSKKDNGYHLSDFESSDEESGRTKRIRVKVTGEDIDRLLKFKKTEREMTKEEQLEQFIDYKLTEANIRLPSGNCLPVRVDEVPVSTTFIEVPKATQTHEPVTKLKRRRDMVDNMFNEGLDSIFSNIDAYRSDSSFTVNPFGTPNRSLDKVDNSCSKSPKKPALVMKSFRWDHSHAKPGNTTTVRNFKGFTGFHNLPSTFAKEKPKNK
ncbi:conserved hypothetical protein [Theileria orientalis strain Shintoku]|uniref:Uncharacterized protein n=1 Tax=Theileria orientalis strain Shintoku TaxID=869250 RepID=J4CC82_THEOR|nr:conserved hypothetical protein [Theileria orientalis strain Shintoku]PVC53162.1 hypothetical protein MACL_00000225 [Theileria orientalis]BAM38937.1 conserved hypothetical protein [Theileria orientalis strain Shintoku]|eukprot:XP_009689238.1 conserved hypothetical protein [Theileria orientalis strain Shintoku]